MEDKQYLDEVGLGEVGKVISKFYASKDDLKDLDSLKDFVSENNSMKFRYVTQEEWQSFDNDTKNFFISKTSDPYIIVALEAKPNSKEDFSIFDDDPVWIWNDIELNKGEEKHGQPYLIVNLPASEELNFNWFDKNGVTDKSYQYKIQLALGLKDYVAYYQIVEAIDGEVKYTNWSCLNDMYSRKWIDKLKVELKEITQRVNYSIDMSYIVNDLTCGGTNLILSAEQGKVLNENKVDKSELPTKLSQLEEDETHKVVTQEEKDAWDKKLNENSDIGHNRVSFTQWNATLAGGYKDPDYNNLLKNVLEEITADIYTLKRNDYEQKEIAKSYVTYKDIIDNLYSDDSTKPLSAKQGKQLNAQIKNLTQEIESLKTQLNELKETPKE